MSDGANGVNRATLPDGRTFEYPPAETEKIYTGKDMDRAAGALGDTAFRLDEATKRIARLEERIALIKAGKASVLQERDRKDLAFVIGFAGDAARAARSRGRKREAGWFDDIANRVTAALGRIP